MNANRQGRGINSRPLPQGQVTVHPDGRRTITTGEGRELQLRRDGTVAAVRMANGSSAAFHRDGKLAAYHARGMVINRPLRGPRTVEVERNGRTIVAMGAHAGYVQRPYYRSPGGVTYVQRTYVVNKVTYTTVYQTRVYGGVAYYGYVPRYYYRPVYYTWAYDPWPAPVYYRWDWYGSPWYAYYGPYFTPYPAYPTASLWLTDYLLAANLQDAYAEGEAAQARADASAAQASQAGANANQAELSPEVKQAIADEVKRQLAAEQAEAGSPQATSGPPQPAPSGAAIPDALNPAERTFIASSSLDVTSADGQQCALTAGDVLMRLSDTPDENQNVTASVQSSKQGDCTTGQTVSVGVQNLQEMHNQFRRQLDSGLKALASNSGKDGLPSAPDARTSDGGIPAPTADSNASAQLANAVQDADQAEKAVAQNGPGS